MRGQGEEGGQADRTTVATREPWLAELDFSLSPESQEMEALIDSARVVIEAEPIAPTPIEALYEPLKSPLELPETAPTLIGVCGDPRHGKDVIAEYIEAHYSGVDRIGAFSNTIKEEVNGFLEPYGHLIDDSNKSEEMYRRLLQDWAVARRREDVDYWTYSVRDRIERSMSKGARLVIVTGLRADNDVKMFRSLGGEVWKAKRPGLGNSATHAIENGLAHMSDSDFDAVVINPVEGDLTPYEANIRAALKKSEA